MVKLSTDTIKRYFQVKQVEDHGEDEFCVTILYWAIPNGWPYAEQWYCGGGPKLAFTVTNS